jgi:hypothetical protein
MSELTVGQLRGLTVNNNVITVPAGHTLKAPGGVIQVVSGFTDTTVTSTTASFINTGLSATITPKLANSIIYVFVSQNGIYKSGGNLNNGVRLRLMRAENVEAVALIGYTGTAEEAYLSWSLQWVHSPNSLSPITFSTQFRNEVTASEARVQQAAHSRITLMEIAQ